MKKIFKCNCKGRCGNRRCACLRENESCGEGCGCTRCANPLNRVDVENLSICAIQNVERMLALTERQLSLRMEMPCGHPAVPLRKLLQIYTCPGCDEEYWYSFCWNHVVQDNCSWHCDICRACRNWREWHCPGFERCTYVSVTALRELQRSRAVRLMTGTFRIQSALAGEVVEKEMATEGDALWKQPPAPRNIRLVIARFGSRLAT